MSDTQLITSWRGYLAGGTAGLHLYDSVHPLQIFIGTTDAGAPRMVVRTQTKPVKPILSNVVLVERYEDKSGKWNLSFTLQDRKFDEVFLRLADDVHARSSSAANEPMALDRVGVVFDEWRRLLKPRPKGLLTMEELRGLVGELWLILNEFAASRPTSAAIEGWLGPMGLPQDFWYASDGFHEAKSIGPSTSRLRISSEHQLDENDLQLIVLQVATTDDQTVGATNLPSLVAKVRSSLAEAAASAEGLDERLLRLGVDLSESFYQDTWFLPTRKSIYKVGPDFPRIAASALSGGISRVTYQLELVDLEEFKVATVEVS
ncbi:hypothetical protein ASC77_14265 [Nocardioides sp. Root1257]|uniref:PD-(D/E)XK motif protein n=1 Tax=unclassified Nocardioides TaxID=2615069 RepID=UPI0006FEA0BD|nr:MULTISPECIES: PD-(D/E)XK motif protein [unclassified Nocardioides]KQW47604.1 hypothetical protein ASC77_14265 [Nocardioides sp. Root1257]KRC45759.1 hypothetical protein ASE24_14265 [Nocardioides sp. Root224]